MAKKSERTRALLLETALRLFREQGYEATTMRRIAAEAGLSPGNAYYYFEGKDELIQELYQRIQDDHRALALPKLRDRAPLAENLRVVLNAGLDVFTPYHGFGEALLHVALRPTSPVSPFSPASRQARESAIDLLSEVVNRSRGVPGGGLGKRLPQLLWLAYLGVTLHWVTDTSPEQHRTRELVARGVPLLAKAIALLRLPGGRHFTQELVEFTDYFAVSAHAEKTGHD